jgi:hypothetical protein
MGQGEDEGDEESSKRRAADGGKDERAERVEGRTQLEGSTTGVRVEGRTKREGRTKGTRVERTKLEGRTTGLRVEGRTKLEGRRVEGRTKLEGMMKERVFDHYLHLNVRNFHERQNF